MTGLADVDGLKIYFQDCMLLGFRQLNRGREVLLLEQNKEIVMS